MIKNRSFFIDVSSSFSNVSCCLSKFNFHFLYFSTNSLNVSGAANNSLQSHLTPKILANMLLCCCIMQKWGFQHIYQFFKIIQKCHIGHEIHL